MEGKRSCVFATSDSGSYVEFPQGMRSWHPIRLFEVLRRSNPPDYAHLGSGPRVGQLILYAWGDGIARGREVASALRDFLD